MLPTETVLETLLRAGAAVPNSCRAGACQSCLLRATNGEVPLAAQSGLKPSLKEQGYFLSCVCRPEQNLAVAFPGAGVRTAVRLVETGWLSENVLRVLLETGEPLNHRAGQYLTLFRPDGLGRSYSIASLPESPQIELHVRIISNGEMSTWLTNAEPGTELAAQGPAGNCFYTKGTADQQMLLAGTGTGLAPLYGIVRDALSAGHNGPIWLYHGALDASGLYLQEELKQLDSDHPQFHYKPTLLNEHGPLPQVLTTDHAKLNGWRGFVCGDPAIVNQLKKRLFLAGMASRDIYSDAFIPTCT